MSNELNAFGKVAKTALNQMGIDSLADLRAYDAENLVKLHGIGPKAIRLMEEALGQEGWSLKESEPLPFKTDFAVFGDLKCNNAPKREIIRDFIVGSYLQEAVYLAERASPELEVDILSGQSLTSLEAWLAYCGENYSQVSSLHIQSMLTHGKEGAAEVMSVTSEGQRSYQAYFFEFASHKKDSPIKAVRIYQL